MDQHIMESLLLDQALDALSPDVEQLLQAYVTDHPEFNSLSESIHQTASLGQKAVRARLPEELPAFPRARLVHEPGHVSVQSMRTWRTIAACILIGMGIGFSLRHSLRLDSQPGLDTVTAQGHVETRPLSAGREVTRTFWSTKAYQDHYKNYPKNARTKADQSSYKRYGKRGLL